MKMLTSDTVLSYQEDASRFMISAPAPKSIQSASRIVLDVLISLTFEPCHPETASRLAYGTQRFNAPFTRALQ